MRCVHCDVFCMVWFVLCVMRVVCFSHADACVVLCVLRVACCLYCVVCCDLRVAGCVLCAVRCASCLCVVRCVLRAVWFVL